MKPESYIYKRLDEIKSLERKEAFDFSVLATSSYANLFTEENFVQVSDCPEFYLAIDDFDIYKSLLYNISKNCSSDKLSLKEIFLVVKETVYGYLGQTNRSDNPQRLCNYRLGRANTSSIKDFYGKDCSECSERAALAHNLFKFLGIESYYMTGNVSINGQKSLHNYNVIYHNGKGYIFDLACAPTKRENGELVRYPLIKKLTQEEMYSLASQRKNTQIKLDVENVFEDLSFCTASGKEYIVNYGGKENQNLLER